MLATRVGLVSEIHRHHSLEPHQDSQTLFSGEMSATIDLHTMLRLHNTGVQPIGDGSEERWRFEDEHPDGCSRTTTRELIYESQLLENLARRYVARTLCRPF